MNEGTLKLSDILILKNGFPMWSLIVFVILYAVCWVFVWRHEDQMQVANQKADFARKQAIESSMRKATGSQPGDPADEQVGEFPGHSWWHLTLYCAVAAGSAVGFFVAGWIFIQQSMESEKHRREQVEKYATLKPRNPKEAVSTFVEWLERGEATMLWWRSGISAIPAFWQDLSGIADIYSASVRAKACAKYFVGPSSEWVENHCKLVGEQIYNICLKKIASQKMPNHDNTRLRQWVEDYSKIAPLPGPTQIAIDIRKDYEDWKKSLETDAGVEFREILSEYGVNWVVIQFGKKRKAKYELLVFYPADMDSSGSVLGADIILDQPTIRWSDNQELAKLILQSFPNQETSGIATDASPDGANI